MNKFLNSTALAAGLAILGFAGAANAATVVTIDSETVYNGSNDAPIFGTVAPTYPTTGNFQLAISGDALPNARSPYELNTVGADTPYSVLSYGGDSGSSATYDLNNSTSFEILWGSPDTYNYATFYDGLGGTGNVIGTFSGASLVCYPSTCNRLAWDDVVFKSTGGGIGSVVLSDSGTAAFEYGLNPASIVNPTPLPAAAWLFGTVIAGAAGAARLRRRKA